MSNFRLAFIIGCVGVLGEILALTVTLGTGQGVAGSFGPAVGLVVCLGALIALWLLRGRRPRG